MPNSPDPNYTNDPNYRKDKSSGSGWAIAGLIVIVVIGIALYQNHLHSANNLSNVEPAAGTNTTYDMQNTNTMNAPSTVPATNTTQP
jgi:hypothetical protein